ncbi:Cysteine--tRNA ligase [Carbonactinospora thermoautotrophica]|uniref:Cysteine--tRNA ligase n=1 Tax=Carbonactinospora thermoautotrophica TaxID=1469144 RepID=A0A132MYW8_9ACTN|nr:Cysteine--tRNA ligase [Carbonactinospora thermoautotrophica]
MRVSLRLYDTSARTVRDFVPLQPGKVGIYLCGATVQAPPHLGHMRPAVSFDVLRRWLERSGYRVTFVQNVTDIDDKILRKAAEQGEPYWAIAYRNELAFRHGYSTLGCLPPTVEPRATGHIPEMIELIRRLIERGHAYPSGGDVYFDVHSYPDYGALSNQRLENIQPSEDGDTGLKRDPRDFALWKGAKPGEPVWDTPWGPGRPGWHLECSAMARKYLGETFDIHGGGVDLVFPHHENEIAQSRAAGWGFARYWLHQAWLTLAGEKMSKSVGNVVSMDSMLQRVRPIVLRYYLVAPHYRSTIEYSDEALAEAAAAFGRIEQFVKRATELVGDLDISTVTLPDGFVNALNDDLGVPQALAVVHTTVRDGNAALAAVDKDAVVIALGQVRAMLDVLGLDPLAPSWAATERGGAEAELREVIDALVEIALEQRQAARQRKDYATADAIRARLNEAGIAVEDTPAGTRWTLKGRP